MRVIIALTFGLFLSFSAAQTFAAPGPRDELIAFIDTHVVVNPKAGEIANLTFFSVGLRGKPDRDRFHQLVTVLDLAPQPGGQERGYLEFSGLFEDRDYALKCMGLGQLLSEWQLLSPDTVMPYLTVDLKRTMAIAGYVTISFLPKTHCETPFQ